MATLRKTEPQIGETTRIKIGGGLLQTVTIKEINREHNFILGQKNPDMIAGPQPDAGCRVRWPKRVGEDEEHEIDSELIFWDERTGLFAIEYNG